MQNPNIILVITVLVSIVWLTGCGLYAQQRMIKSLRRELMIDKEPLLPCRYCGATVNISPISDSYYIECKKCGIHTRYFSYKNELINYWNGGK